MRSRATQMTAFTPVHSSFIFFPTTINILCMQKAFNVNAAHGTYNIWMLELSVYDDDNTVYINKVTEKEKCILKLMGAA